MVRAVKGTLAANRYAMIRALDGATYRVAAGFESLAFNIFGQWGARVLHQWHDTLLAPVPASSHTQFGISFTGSRSYEPLARRLCKGVYDLAGGNHSQWVSVSKISQHIKVKDEEMLNGAISFAARNGWMMVGGQPVHSVLLTQPAKWPHLGRDRITGGVA